MSDVVVARPMWRNVLRYVAIVAGFAGGVAALGPGFSGSVRICGLVGLGISMSIIAYLMKLRECDDINS